MEQPTPTTPKAESTIIEIFKKHSVDVSSMLEVLHANLPFLKDGINLVIGESKAGKTYTTIKSLVDNGFKDYVIHLDFDRNADGKLKELGVETYHINDVSEFTKELSDNFNKLENSLLGKIVVIDSLQDLSLDNGIDSNQGALATMNKVQGFKYTGATIIVIHHVTLENNGSPKVKGNSSVITSKADTTISFVKDDLKGLVKRTMTVLNTRAEDKIPSKKTFTFDNLTTKASSAVPK